MDDRKFLILNTIIREHIETGAPVGSGVLVRKYELGVSAATVRNEMAKLEEEGYIVQPHTSAGRVPTEDAYRMYLEKLGDDELACGDCEKISDALGEMGEMNFKDTAKLVSKISGNTVIWAFHRHNLYYTGISNLFQQPEFSQLDVIYNLSTIVDRFDEIVDDVFGNTGMDLEVMIGEENPFGAFCSTVLIKYRRGNDTGMIGILGPMRMDYKKNLALVKFLGESINNR